MLKIQNLLSNEIYSLKQTNSYIGDIAKISIPIHVIIFILFAFISMSCKTKSNNIISNDKIKISATYSKYVTAMGKGRGVIFRLQILSNKAIDLTIDSFYVNSKSLSFVTKKIDNGLSLECNYLINISDPYINPDGSTTIEKEVDDPIIKQNSFYPSWVILNQNGKLIKAQVEQFFEIKQEY